MGGSLPVGTRGQDMRVEEAASGRGVWWAPRLVGPVAWAAAIRCALLAAALLRTGTGIIASGDTASYLEPGRNLLFHGAFVTGGIPEIGRTPGYPFFLALASVAGLPGAVLAQVVVSVVTVVLAWRLGRAVFRDEQTALGAAWLFAFEPVSIIYSVRLLPETVFLALCVMTMERLAVFLRDRRPGAVAEAGLWLAAATFVRPVTYYLPLALAAGLGLLFARVPGLRWKAPAALLLTVLPWLAAWQLRNRVETGFGGFSSIVARNLYFYEAAEVTARVEHRPFAAVQSELGYPDEWAFGARHPEQRGWSEAERVRSMGAAAGAVARAHPGVALAAQLEGSGVVALTPCAADLLRLLGAYPADGSAPGRVVNAGPAQSALRLAWGHPIIAAAMAVLEAWLLILYGCAARGMMRRTAGRGARWLMAGVFIYFLGVSGGAQAVGRYRLPVMPIVCVFAAAGLRARADGLSESNHDRP